MILQPRQDDIDDNIDDIYDGILKEHGKLPSGIEFRFWPHTKSHLANERRSDAFATMFGSVGISARQIVSREDGAERFALAHATCVRTGASLTINYSPWHVHWKQHDPRGWGEKAINEMASMTEAFKYIRQLLDAANAAAGVDVEVAMVFLDQEVLWDFVDENGEPDKKNGRRPEQTAAMKMKNMMAHAIVGEWLPGVTRAHHGQLGSHHTAGEPHDGVADTELYVTNQKSAMGLQFQRLVDKVDKVNAMAIMTDEQFHTIMPWIGIGGFYRHGWGKPAGWEDDVAFEPGLIWDWAREAMHPHFRLWGHLSGRPDYNRCNLFGIWPQRNTLKWHTHFIAMLAGAHNEKEFENDWPGIAI